MASRVCSAIRLGWACVLLLAGCMRGLAGEDSAFGFSGPEIFPVNPLIDGLRVADFDGDGWNDLLVANNSRSKINILYNQTAKTNRPAQTPPAQPRELNELPPDARFRIESIASEQHITALVVTDLDSDGRPDLACYGEPKELLVYYNDGNRAWSAPRRWALEDGLLSLNALAAGDLNGDGRADLVLLAETHVHLLRQTGDRSLAEPVKIPLAMPARSVQVVDLDGDGRQDLLLVDWASRMPLRFRLQDSRGELGPEFAFTMPPFRAYWADTLEDDRHVQLITIAQSSGRAAVGRFVRRPAEPLGPFRQGQFQLLPLSQTDKARRGLLWADLDGDRRVDLVVAEPESGRLAVRFQQPDGTLAGERTYPSLMGITDMAVADWDQDGRVELFLLSQDEKAVGVVRPDAARHLPFPTLLPLDGKPLALAAGPLQPGAPATLCVILDNDGQRNLLRQAATGRPKSQRLDARFKGNPTTLVIHDANRDGRPDLVALIPYEKIKVLLQTAQGDFEEHDIAPPGGGLENPWLSLADLDGDGQEELLLAQQNFVRAVVLRADPPSTDSTNGPTWKFEVREQINGADSRSRLVGATTLPGGSNTPPTLFLMDAERKTLSLCTRDTNGLWQTLRHVPLPVTDFVGLRPVALGAEQPNCIAFLGLQAVAWLALTGEVWEFSEWDTYETPIRDGYLRDVTAGDLNQDGRKDLVFLETEKNHLDLVLFSREHQLLPGNRWQVFERRTFRGHGVETPEPREAAVADVTGDGRNDLIVVVHDRILVYPQE